MKRFTYFCRIISILVFIVLKSSYVFAITIDSVSPDSGTSHGGTEVTIYGSGFASGGDARVIIGQRSVWSYEITYASDGSWLRFTTPAHSAGIVNITVRNPDGQEVTLLNAFTYTGSQPADSLTVTIQPSGARDAGGQWRLVNMDTWYNSGHTETDLPAGNYIVEFKEIDGWEKPDDQMVTIIQGQATNIFGNYNQQFGSLQVIIEPEQARTAGAQWRREQWLMPWRDSGYTQTNLPVGDIVITFKETVGWSKPANTTVAILADQTTSITKTYTPITYTVNALAGAGGRVLPSSQAVEHGMTATFTVTPDVEYTHGRQGGTCPAGHFNDDIYTTGVITADCSVSFSFTQSEGRPIVLPGVLMLLLDDD